MLSRHWPPRPGPQEAEDAAAPAAARAPAPAAPERVTSVEGITEYRLANGLRVLLFPDPSQADDHGEHHLPRRLAPRGLRRDRHGAPARAHGVQGHAAATRTSRSELHDARRALQRHHLRTTAPTTSRPSPATDENLELGARARGRPHGQLASSRKKDLDTEMTVVRNEFEMGENSPSACCSSACCRPPIVWHNYGKSTIGARSDIENVPIERLQAFYRKYYQPDNAVLVVAGQVRRGEGARARREALRRRSRSPTRTLPRDLHRRAGAGRRAQRDAAPRRRRAGRRRRSTTCPPGSHPDFAGARAARRRCSATRRRAACTRRWSRRRRPPPSFGVDAAAARSRHARASAPQVRDGRSRSTRRATR